MVSAGASAAAGCGDEAQPRLTPTELFARLAALPGVTVEERPTEQRNYSYYVLRFTQPIDHAHPDAGTFQQQVSLLHRNEQAPVPMVVHTSGYSDEYGEWRVELTRLLAANQVSIEHRFFGASRPDPTDWSKLTIAQMAADEHAIIAALRTVYEGAFLTTGGSKGGMTAVFHRRFFPDDVDGTVPYVAPISFGAPDVRYPAYLDSIGHPDCRQAVRDVATLMLSKRRDAMVALAQAQTGHVYTRIPLDLAVEAAISALEWQFWQMFGVDECASVPAVKAGEVTDAALFEFLERVSPVSDSDDTQIIRFEPYYYQTCAELGYPDYGGAYLEPFRRYDSDDYTEELPTLAPLYDKAVMLDIDDFVEHQGDRLLFVYGEWDPWTAGKFALGNAADSALLIQPQGNHRAGIARLEGADREDALAKLKAWTGVTPVLSWALSDGPSAARDTAAPPLWRRMPPALARALQGQK